MVVPATLPSVAVIVDEPWREPKRWPLLEIVATVVVADAERTDVAILAVEPFAKLPVAMTVPQIPSRHSGWRA